MRFQFFACALALSSSTLVVAAIGCGASPDGSTNAPSVAESAGYTGEALMKGVFFDIGPAAEKLLEPHVSHAAKSDAQLARVDALVARVGELNPEFFAGFADDLQSGDPLRVENALTSGRNLLANTKWEIPQLPPLIPVTPGRPGVAPGGGGIAIANGNGQDFAVATDTLSGTAVFQAAECIDNHIAVSSAQATVTGGGGGGIFEREQFAVRVANTFRR